MNIRYPIYEGVYRILTNKISRNHTAMDFQTGDDALPEMTSCYISTAYNEPSL